MDFPQQSIEQARWIAQQYRSRTQSNKDIAERLYLGDFLHLGYGFEDALRFGRTGTYLHEAKKDVECFSLAGILYLVARETGLSPQLYRASDYTTFKEGTPASDITSGGEHAFITVTMRGKEWIVDPFLGMFGKLEHDKERHRFKVKKVRDGNKMARYGSLTPLSPETYLTMLEESRKPGQGMGIINAGQVIHIRNTRVVLNLDNDTLWSSAQYGNEIRYTGDEEQWDTIALRTGAKNTAWREAVRFFSSDSAWLPQDRTHTGRMVVPMELTKEYLSHIAIAAKASGRKTPLADIKKNTHQFLYNHGFGKFGELTRANGVDPRAHEALLARIDATYEQMERSPFTAPVLERDGTYYRERKERITHDNPTGLLRTTKELRAHLEDIIAGIEKQNGEKAQLNTRMYRRIIHGHRPDKIIRKQRIAEIALKTRTQLEDAKIFMPLFGNDYWQETLDIALYKEQHPLGSVSASEEDVLFAYRARVRSMMAPLMWLLPRLAAKRFIPGVKRLLA